MISKGRRDATQIFLDMINKMDMMSMDHRDAATILLDMMNMIYEILSHAEVQRVQRFDF